MKSEKYSRLRLFFLLPVVIVLAIVPLIVYDGYNALINSSSIFYNVPNDFFSATKSGLIVALGPLALICALISSDRLKKDVRYLLRDHVFQALGIYIVFVILSTIFSEYRDVAFYGCTSRNEGMLVILCYFFLWLAVVLQVREEIQVKLLLYSIYFCVFVTFFVGISQIIDKNIISSEAMRRFIMGKEAYELSGTYVNILYSGVVNLTFSNPNYVGSYMGMIVVVCFSLFIIAESTKDIVLHGIAAALSSILLVICYSKGGYVAASVGLMFILIVFGKKAVRRWRSISALVAVILISLLVLNCVLSKSLSLSFDRVLRRNANTVVYEESPEDNTAAAYETTQYLPDSSSLEKYNNSEPITASYERGELKISIKDNLFSLERTFTGQSFNIRIDDGNIVCFDETMEEIPIPEKNYAFNVDKENFPKLNIEIKMPDISVYTDDDKQIINLTTKNDWFYFSTYDGKIVDAKEIEKLAGGQFVEDFDFKDNTISVTTTGGKVFNVEYDGENVNITDDAGNPIEYIFLQNEAHYFLNSPGYEGYIVYAHGDSVALVTKNPVTFVYEDGRIRLLTLTNKKVDSSRPEVFPLLANRKDLFSGRGYIWARSIPLMKDTILLGHGPDTFVFYFPMYDIKASLETFSSYKTYVDKPHMLYLQIGINTGVLSLIAFLVAFALYYIKTLMLLLRNALKSKWFQYNICFAGGVLAYLVAGIINDSVVSVAPTFYIVFALGHVSVWNYLDEKVEDNGRKRKK